MQVFNKLAGILLALTLLFLCPVYLMTQRQEAVMQLAVLEVMTTYTEQWKQSGYVTKNSYEEAVRKLAALGSFELELDYRRRVLEPVWKDGEIEQVATVYLAVPWEELKETLYGAAGGVRMYQEDRLTLHVKEAGNSPGSRLRSFLFGSRPSHVIRYGGVVTGEMDEWSAVLRDFSFAFLSGVRNSLQEPGGAVLRSYLAG